MENIGRSNADSSFRYKMPKLQTKIEGRGNGIKTVIVNMVEIARALHVDPAYPTKYFGFELGAQSKFEPATERAIVNGAHQAPDLSKLLNKFIDSFVLCPTCKLPEIKMQVTQKITIDCAACGHNSVLKSAHKLATYIIKNPPLKPSKAGAAPSAKSAAVDEAADAAEGEAKKTKKAGKKGKAPSAAAGEDGKDGEEADATGADGSPAAGAAATTDGGEASPVSPAAAATAAAASAKVKEEAPVKWFTDTSADAQKARQESEFAEMKKHEELMKKSIAAAVGKDAKAGAKIDDPVALLKLYMTTSKRTADETLSELKRIALARGLDDRQRCTVFLSASLGEGTPEQLIANIKTHTKVLQKLSKEHKNASVLLGCLESFLGSDKKLLARTPHVFQALYEQDVLSEEAILAWADTPAESSWVNKDVAASVRKKAAPFVTWLKNAEEDD